MNNNINLIYGNVIPCESKVSLKSMIENIDFQRIIFDLNDEDIPSKEEVTYTAMFFIKNFPLKPIYAYRNSDGKLQVIRGNKELLSLYFFYKGIYLEAKNVDYPMKFKDIFTVTQKHDEFKDIINENYRVINCSYNVCDTKNNETLSLNFLDLPAKLQDIINKTSIYLVNVVPSEEEVNNAINLYRDIILT